MKHLHSFIVFLIFITSSVQADDFRTFTGSNGKAIEAILLNYDSDTKIVKIKLKNGKENNVPLSLFSEADQDFIKNGGKEKSDNPFGDEPVPKQATAKPIDMKFILDEAKKAMEQLEKDHRNKLAVGHIPSVYADYALIQKLAGRNADAKKSIEMAVELNESVTDTKDHESNVGKIAMRAFEIGSKDIAKKLVDEAAKNGMKSHEIVIAKYWLGDESGALLTAASGEEAWQRAWYLAKLGGAYLKQNKFEKANEVFAGAVAAESNKGANYTVCELLEAGKIDEARKFFDKIQDPNEKTRSLIRFAYFYFDTDNKSEMKKSIDEATAIATRLAAGRYISTFYFVINDIPTSRRIRSEWMKKIEQQYENNPNKVECANWLTYYCFQEMLWEGTSTKEVIERQETLSSKTTKNDIPSWWSNMYLDLANWALFCGDKNSASEMSIKAERYINQINGQERDFLNRRLEHLKNSSGHEWGVTEFQQVIPALMKSNQSDRILPILERVKLPQARIYALQIIAEELDKLKK